MISNSLPPTGAGWAGGLGVQGVERQERKLLDTAALVGHLVPEGSVFAFLATHRGQLPWWSFSRSFHRPQLAGSGPRVWVRLAGLWGDGISELVKDYDAAEGGLVEALVVGLDVLVEHGEQPPVEFAHLLLRQVQHEARVGTNRTGSGFA
jgi:hypothetical protein